MSEHDEQGPEATADQAETSAPVSAKKAAPRKAPAKKAPAKRVRRTKEQIMADELAELKKQLELAQLKLAVKEVAEQELQETVAELRPAKTKKTRVFHVVEDGFTALGKTWVRGEEIFIEPNSKEEQLAYDRDGNFLFDLDDYEQMERFDGTVFFREGPWPGLKYDPRFVYEDGQVDEHGRKIEVSDAEIAALEKANKEREKKLARAGYR